MSLARIYRESLKESYSSHADKGREMKKVVEGIDIIIIFKYKIASL